MFQPLDTVRLKNALPGAGLAAGALGAVLEVFKGGHCLVEFTDAQGQTIAEPVLAPEQLELAPAAHARA